MFYSPREQVSHHYVQAHLKMRSVYFDHGIVESHFQGLGHYDSQHREIPVKGAVVLKVPLGSSNNLYSYMVLLDGVRHSIPNLDTLSGLEIPDHLVYDAMMDEIEMLKEGPPLEACRPASQGCKNNVYYKALHNFKH